MKKVVTTALLLAVAVTLALSLSLREESLAITGCCKIRNSIRDNWRIDKRDFDQCKKLNDEEDRDDVFEPGGLIWWDIRCR